MSEALFPPSHMKIRFQLEKLILGDLHGPAGVEEEVVDELYVRDCYILGLLAPKGPGALLSADED